MEIVISKYEITKTLKESSKKNNVLDESKIVQDTSVYNKSRSRAFVECLTRRGAGLWNADFPDILQMCKVVCL